MCIYLRQGIKLSFHISLDLLTAINLLMYKLHIFMRVYYI